MTILICAATRSEHGAVQKGIAASGAGRLTRGGFEMLLTGVGPQHAARALRERLDHGSLPDLVVSTGLAGALSGDLAIASWITAARLFAWDGRTRSTIDDLELRQAPASIAASPCELISSADLVTTSSSIPREPSLADGLAVAVDMETAALATECTRRGAPLLVLRMISDTPAEPLPAFLSPFAAAMASDGLSSRVKHASRGLRGVLGDPRGVARILREGPGWNRKLEEGWSHHASALA